MKLERIFADICNGYSIIDCDKKYFLKHLSFIEQSIINLSYDHELEKATALGLLTEEQWIKNLIVEKKWPQLKEISIKSCDKDIKILEESKKKIKDKLEINPLYDSIKELETKRDLLIEERSKLIINSADSFARTTIYPLQLSLLLYRDKELLYPAFSIDDLEYLDSSEYNKLVNLVADCLYLYRKETLKNICVQPFFYMMFSMTDDLFNFFGKPIVKLSYLQSNLLSLARTFSKMRIEVPDIPEEFEDNADKVCMWYYLKQNDGIVSEEEIRSEENKFRSLIHQQR